MSSGVQVHPHYRPGTLQRLVAPAEKCNHKCRLICYHASRRHRQTGIIGVYTTHRKIGHIYWSVVGICDDNQNRFFLFCCYQVVHAWGSLPFFRRTEYDKNSSTGKDGLHRVRRSKSAISCIFDYICIQCWEPRSTRPQSSALPSKACGRLPTRTAGVEAIGSQVASFFCINEYIDNHWWIQELSS